MTDGGFAERIREGERLARTAGDPTTDDRLLQLLLDPQDTAVTYRTALALLARRDRHGLELVLRADAQADGNAGEWIGSAFSHFRAASGWTEDVSLRAALQDVATGPDAQLRDAAAELLEWLHLR